MRVFPSQFRFTESFLKLHNNTFIIAGPFGVLFSKLLSKGKFSVPIVAAVTIKSVSSGQGITLYPNPVAGDEVFLRITDAAAGDMNVKVYDMSGKLVRDIRYKAGTYNSNAITVNVEGIAAGAYMLQITEADSSVHNIKFNKQ